MSQDKNTKRARDYDKTSSELNNLKRSKEEEPCATDNESKEEEPCATDNESKEEEPCATDNESKEEEPCATDNESEELCVDCNRPHHTNYTASIATTLNEDNIKSTIISVYPGYDRSKCNNEDNVATALANLFDQPNIQEVGTRDDIPIVICYNDKALSVLHMEAKRLGNDSGKYDLKMTLKPTNENKLDFSKFRDLIGNAGVDYFKNNKLPNPTSIDFEDNCVNVTMVCDVMTMCPIECIIDFIVDYVVKV